MGRPFRRAPASALAVIAAVALIACGDDEPPINSGAANYEVTLPGEWTERSDTEKQEIAEQAGAAVESAADAELDVEDVALTSYWSDGEPSPETPNAIVIREPLPEGMSQDQFVDVSIENATRTFADRLVGEVRPIADVDVGDQAAPAFDYRIELGGTTQAKRVVFIFREDVVYTLTLTALPPDFKDSAADLDEILASWTWQ